MSSIKRYFESISDPDGIDAPDDKYVSAACFEEQVLKKFIADNITDQPCSYYSGEGNHPKGAPLGAVVRFIFEGFCSRYDDAANGVGYEGEYVGADVTDSYDLVHDYVETTLSAGDTLLQDIIGALPDRTWSATDPYASQDHEVYSWSWNSFVETVKHRRRYFFEESANPYFDEAISPRGLLKMVAANCRRARLIRTLSAGTEFFRCRSRSTATPITEPLDLGPPPCEFASQSRMSPAGVAMFYGALDQETARAETLANRRDRHTMATFALSRSIRVLDLTKVPAISIFDQNRRSLYGWSIFMGQFIRDLGKKVERDNRMHIDYVPTQIVTEYFRTFMVDSKRAPIQGIRYRSTKTGRHCVVLFADREDVSPLLHDVFDPACEELLQMTKVTQHKRTRRKPKTR